MIKNSVIVSIFLVIVAPSIFAERTLLHSPSNTFLNQARLLGSVDPKESILISIWIKSSKENEWPSDLSDVYNPNSANYHHFLTAEQFDEQYGESFLGEKALEVYFKNNGLQAEIKNHRVDVIGSFEKIQQLFQVTINRYEYQHHIVFATPTKPTLKANLAKHVLAITGLDNLLRYEPMFVQINTKAHSSEQLKNTHQIHVTSLKQSSSPGIKSQQLFLGSNLRQAYHLNDIPPVNGTLIDGSGQTILILNACGGNTPKEIMADANLYNATANISPLTQATFRVVTPQGQSYDSSTCTETNKSSWRHEIALDVEAAHTLAPGANIVLVLTENSNSMDRGIADLIHYVSNHNHSIAGFSNAYIISNSWGYSKDSPDFLSSSFFQAGMQGISVNYASGDAGDNTNNGNLPPFTHYPASSQFVTAVGGTSLCVDDNWNYACETGWGTRTSNSTFESGSGGGISQYSPSPLWQSILSDFTAGGYNGTIGSYGKRVLPDIAMLADPHTGLYVFERNDCFYWCGIGGTSLATPLLSATIALVNQSRALASGGNPSPIGLIAPYLYTSLDSLATANALHVISPPHQIIPGSHLVAGAPFSAFESKGIVFNWNSTLKVIERQFWNDSVGVGSPNIPNFVTTMSRL